MAIASRTGKSFFSQENGIGMSLCEVGSRDRRDGHIGSGKCGGIVEPVADHDHFAARCFQLFECRDLIGRLGAAAPIGDAERRGNRCDSLRTVTGQDTTVDAEIAQGFDRCCCVGAKRLPDHENCPFISI